MLASVGDTPRCANHLEMGLPAPGTFQLDQDLAGFDLVDEIREAPIALGAADLDLGQT